VRVMKLSIKQCNSFKNRFIGMMFLKEKKPIGYYFKKCHSIHTFFCYYPLDIVLLDKNNSIIDIKYNLKPWRVFFFKCYSIIEFPNGFINELDKDYFKNLI